MKIHKKVAIILAILIVCALLAGCCGKYRWAMVRLPNGLVIVGKLDSYIRVGQSIRVVIEGQAYATHFSNVVLMTGAEE